jgi:sugar phosphate isomerase/epimerase
MKIKNEAVKLTRISGLALLVAAAAWAADAPLYVFDDGLDHGGLSLQAQVELVKRTGYAGVFYTGTQHIPELLVAHRSRGLKLLGTYTGTDISSASPGLEPGLPEAIEQLRGTGALIVFTVRGQASDADERAVPVIRKVCDMAAQSGLKVALYPHVGFHVARIEDALRLREKVDRSNLGVVFNLCHWLKSGDEANLAARLQQAMPYLMMVSINGADHEGDWDRLIQTLDRGTFDLRQFLKTLADAGYRGPIGLQCYAIKGDQEENLRRSMTAWQALNAAK